MQSFTVNGNGRGEEKVSAISHFRIRYSRSISGAENRNLSNCGSIFDSQLDFGARFKIQILIINTYTLIGAGIVWDNQRMTGMRRINHGDRARDREREQVRETLREKTAIN